jgi:hypothetical protein
MPRANAYGNQSSEVFKILQGAPPSPYSPSRKQPPGAQYQLLQQQGLLAAGGGGAGGIPALVHPDGPVAPLNNAQVRYSNLIGHTTSPSRFSQAFKPERPTMHVPPAKRRCMSRNHHRALATMTERPPVSLWPPHALRAAGRLWVESPRRSCPPSRLTS